MTHSNKQEEKLSTSLKKMLTRKEKSLQGKERPEHGYWIIPEEIYDPLNQEFGFDFDPCPNPRPKDFDGLKVEWKTSNWVNPPFWAGITAWVRKAIEEQQKGKDSVLILPLDNWVALLLKASAEIRVVGNHDWIHTKDGSRRKAPRPSFLFILRGVSKDPMDLIGEVSK